MKTNKLYQQDVYLTQCTAKVLLAEPSQGEKTKGCKVVLDQTIFFPTGGGQSCDRGTINGYSVTDVYEDGDQVIHLVEGQLQPEDIVTCSLDWAHRFDNMQRHCGEHILSGMFFREFGGVNRGFHMGEEYMTVDISLEAMDEYRELTLDMCLHVQDCTNQAIWQNLPVTVRRFNTREEAEGLPLRKALAIDEEISIVCVGREENPSDCVACCGTHPATSGQVGLLKIFKVEKNKGMYRVYFEAGKRAMEDYNQKHQLITTLGNKYSGGAADLMTKISAAEERNRVVREQFHVLRKSVIDSRIAQLKEAYSGFYVAEYSDLVVDDVLHIGRG
ncbi:MAG: alanyl-tRNA editing protein, partial [Anaerovoracaceae bacterium]